MGQCPFYHESVVICLTKRVHFCSANWAFFIYACATGDLIVLSEVRRLIFLIGYEAFFLGGVQSCFLGVTFVNSVAKMHKYRINPKATGFL